MNRSHLYAIAAGVTAGAAAARSPWLLAGLFGAGVMVGRLWSTVSGGLRALRARWAS